MTVFIFALYFKLCVCLCVHFKHKLVFLALFSGVAQYHFRHDLSNYVDNDEIWMLAALLFRLK